MTNNTSPFKVPLVLRWENPGPQSPPKSELKDLYNWIKTDWMMWPDQVQICRQGLGETEIEDDCVFERDGLIDDWLFEQYQRWSDAATSGSANDAILQKIADGEMDTEVIADLVQRIQDKSARTRPLPNQLPLLIPDDSREQLTTATVPAEIERELFIANCWSESFDYRNDAASTYDQCCEICFGIGEYEVSLEHFISEAEVAGFRIIVDSALDTEVQKSGDQKLDLEWLFQLHLELIDWIEWYFPYLPDFPSSLAGYPDREIIRLALPLLRWGCISEKVRGNNIDIGQVLEQLPPCDTETWSNFSNLFCRYQVPEHAVKLSDEVMMHKIVVRFLDRSRVLGYELPLVPNEICVANQARSALEKLFREATPTAATTPGIESTQLPSAGEVERAESRAEKKKKTEKKWPLNSDARELIFKMRQELPNGKKKNEIARNYTGETCGKSPKADALLRTLRNYSHLLPAQD